MTPAAVMVTASEEDSSDSENDDCEIYDEQDFETSCRELEGCYTSDFRFSLTKALQ